MTKPPTKTSPRQAEDLRADARQNHARLLTAASEAFAEKGADAPLEDIARRAGVGIGTLYRHFPTRLDLQAAAFRNQVTLLCGEALEMLDRAEPERAFYTWMRIMASYFMNKRGLSKALMQALGKDSEVMETCWTRLRDTTERTLTLAQQAGTIRPDVSAMDVMRLAHGVVASTEHDPDQAPRLLAIMMDGLRAAPESGTRALSPRARASQEPNRQTRLPWRSDSPISTSRTITSAAPRAMLARAATRSAPGRAPRLSETTPMPIAMGAMIRLKINRPPAPSSTPTQAVVPARSPALTDWPPRVAAASRRWSLGTSASTVAGSSSRGGLIVT
jgi:AcrR family transcriptional regulator